MRPSFWNHYFPTPDFQQQLPTEQGKVDSQEYYIRPTYNNNPERFQRHLNISEQYNGSISSVFEPSTEDIPFVPLDIRNNSEASIISDANSIAVSNSDSASVCPTSSATREKSKNAARMRRSNENCEYKELSQCLPLHLDEKVVLDKASTIRLTTNFLKLRSLLSANGGNGQNVMPRQTCLSTAMEEALDGFLLILCGEGSVLFISDTVKRLLGLSKWEIAGTKFVDIVKKEDQNEFMESLLLTPWEESMLNSINEDYFFMRRFVIRVKCLLSKSKNSLSCEGFRAIHFAGNIKARIIHDNGVFVKHVDNLIGVAHTLPIVSRISTEVKLNHDMFMFRACLDLKLTFVDEQIEHITGYLPKDIMEKSLYDLIHCGDAEEVAESHRMHKGQVTFKLFRLLCPQGGWIWIQAYAVILRGSRVSKSDHVVGFANAVTIQAANLKFALIPTTVDSEGSCEEEIVTTSIRRKRRHPVPDSEHMDGDMFSMDQFNTDLDHYHFYFSKPNPPTVTSKLEHYHKTNDHGEPRPQIDGDTPNPQGDAKCTVDFPTTFVFQSFMQQLSINNSSSTCSENCLYPLPFQHRY
ncbi:hypothetical protein Aperf_G00000116312 [Anoplocephala perfoliata]